MTYFSSYIQQLILFRGMNVKFQLRDSIKHTKLDGVNNYQEFKQLAKSRFPQIANEDFFFYYYDQQNDRAKVKSDKMYEIYIAQKIKKIYIKLPNQDYQNQTQNQSVLDRTISNKDNILPKELSKNESADKSSQSKSNAASQKSSKVEPKPFQQQLLEKKSSKTQKVAEKQKVNTTVHKGINCQHCKGEIMVIRWKCLDQIETDVCNKCKDKFHNKEHTMLKIETEDFLSNINYRPSLYLLGNPNFKQSPSDKSVKPWITDKDLAQPTPDAVRQIYLAFEPMALEIANSFSDWQKEYQLKAIK